MNVKHLLGYSVPLAVTAVFFVWYSQSVLSESELLKLSGLVGITLISITFLVGPFSRFWQPMNQLKIFRKMWGISAFCAVTLHVLLAMSVRYSWDLGLAFSVSRNKYWLGFYFGLASFLYFGFMTAISNRFSMQKMGQSWKQWQTIGYLALYLAWLHFIILETHHGDFSIQRTLGRIAFALVTAALVARVYVWLWAWRTGTHATIGQDSSSGESSR